MRVVIADDHTVVREGLKYILAQAQDVEIVGEAADCRDAIEQATTLPADVLVLDIFMPGPGGLETLREVKRRRSDIGVLVLSSHAEDYFAIKLLREGADGYMNKQSAAEELLGALRKVYNGGKYVSPVLGERLAVDLQRGLEAAPHHRLSSREFQVFERLGRGDRVSTIAKDLFLSPKTVSTYRTRILEKLGLTSNAEIMRYAIVEGIVDPANDL